MMTGRVAILIQHIGGVPLGRIRFDPNPGTAVERDLLLAEPRHQRLHELVDGVLVEKAGGYRESVLNTLLCAQLSGFVRSHNLGLVTGPGGPFHLAPGLVRLPDAAFTSWDLLPGRRVPDEPIPHLAPDLAVEVLSERNTSGEMARKRHDYFIAGVRLVWLANPDTRTVDVYTSENQFTRLTEADALDGGAVLWGFRLPLRDWFAELDRHG